MYPYCSNLAHSWSDLILEAFSHRDVSVILNGVARQSIRETQCREKKGKASVSPQPLLWHKVHEFELHHGQCAGKEAGQEESRAQQFWFSFRAPKLVVSCDFHFLPVISLILPTVCVAVTVFSELDSPEQLACPISHTRHLRFPPQKIFCRQNFPGLRK